jgi:hypothetical protein
MCAAACAAAHRGIYVLRKSARSGHELTRPPHDAERIMRKMAQDGD